MMRHVLKYALGVSVLAVAATGCNSFLESESAINDPNQPTQATRDQLFIAIQAGQIAQQEAGVAMFSCLMIQHCSGSGNFVEGWAQYAINSGSHNVDFNQVFTGGGLVDLRRVKALADADGDKVYLGIVKTWEALAVSFGADNWGDIPYSDSSSTPSFDRQMAVYDALQTLLDEAIADLGGSGAGPGPLDLTYGGDKTKWRQAAFTLKARLYLHTAEVRGAAAYTAAIAAANNGISTRTNDFLAFHGNGTNERNMWYQFANTTFGQYLKAGEALVELMKARGDNQRLSQYFSEVAPGQYRGSNVNAPTELAVSEVATVPSSTRIDPTFRQPILTYDETQLILAEAKERTTGVATAQLHLNNVRTFYGLPIAAATLQAIAEEEYVTYFQNVEAWQSYKRTCYPNLTPYLDADPPLIPSRLYYGQTEENANPNVPGQGEQNTLGGVGKRNRGTEPTGSTAAPGMNPNDPPGGTVNNAGACLGT